MTPDPIEVICEEMERCVTAEGADAQDMPWPWVSEWAARLRAWWSPQRKAFEECAEKLADGIRMDARGSIVFDGAEAERLMKLRHALCESEKKL